MKGYIRKLYVSFQWIILAIVSKLPSHIIRKAILSLLGLRMDGAVLYGGFHIRKPDRIVIGAGTVVGHSATLDGRNCLSIGKNVNISSEVMIWTMQHDYNSPGFCATGGEVVIGDYAWLSARAIILPGVRIGEGAVVAAGAVVTQNVPDYTVVGGVPAKVIANRTRELNYCPAKMGVIPFV